MFRRFSDLFRSAGPLTYKTAKTRLPLSAIREQLTSALDDCDDRVSQRVIYQIQIAATAQDLWLLRSDIHQCIARVHSQAEASVRIDKIAKTFDGWLPAHQLSPGRNLSRFPDRSQLL